MRKKKNPNEMDLSGHVIELKHRMMFVLVVFLVVFIAAYVKSNDLMKLITSLGKSIGYRFIYLAPQEVIVQQFRIAGVTALICDLPIIVYEIAEYIDYMIPKSYAKWYLKDHDRGPGNMKVNPNDYGLIYQYECNYKK